MRNSFLAVGPHNKAGWDQPGYRRRGLRELHRHHRYGITVNSPQIAPLTDAFDNSLALVAEVAQYLQDDLFTGLCIARNGQVLFERYAADFKPEALHSIQSISKTGVHWLAASLVDEGRLSMNAPVSQYLPQIGSGYADAPVQLLFDMALGNAYIEDYEDTGGLFAALEHVHGWRLAPKGTDRGLQAFLADIPGFYALPPGQHDYKTANTDVAAWVVETLSGVSLRASLLELVEAFQPEGPVVASTDRQGTPFFGGGLHMTLRDMVRYGQFLGDLANRSAFTQNTLKDAQRGTLTPVGVHYRNFLFTNGNWIGHLGYGGQWLMVYPQDRFVVACFSAQQDPGGLSMSVIGRLIKLGEAVYRVS